MSSSLWSITSDRSSSSLSWEEENDGTSENYLQNLFETIDRVVFSDQPIPEDFPSDLAEECQLWRQKFAQKLEKNRLNSRANDRKPSKLKSLSASETEQINVNYSSNTRSLSERRSSKTRLDLIPNKLNNRRDLSNGRERTLITNQKPLILPPLVNVSHIKRNQSQTYKPNLSKVPNINQMRTSFPKPAPVLSLEHLLSQSKNSLIEKKGTKYSIVLNDNKVGKSQHKSNEICRPSVLPMIHK